MQSFRDRTALVTGGAAGIGRALCERLAEFGALVVVVDINGHGAEEVAALIRRRGSKAEAIMADVSNATQIEALVSDVMARLGRVDFMFNNAAIAAVGELRDGNIEDFRRIVDINLFGVVHGTMAAYRAMVGQGFGHIVNVSSMTGLMPTPIISAYSTTKWAIVGFSTAVRVEAAGLGVKISVACPSLVQTDIGDRSIYWNVRKADYLRWLPWKRLMLTPAQAAEAILGGTVRNKDIIVFPLSAAIGWRVYRICPWVFGPLFRQTLEGFRALRIKP